MVFNDLLLRKKGALDGDFSAHQLAIAATPLGELVSDFEREASY